MYLAYTQREQLEEEKLPPCNEISITKLALKASVFMTEDLGFLTYGKHQRPI